MVAVPCRRLVQAAWWNGHAPQATTGVASISGSHCQSWNCSAGTMEIPTTGTVSATATTSRRRSATSGSWSAGSGPRVLGRVAL